jgi:hypothetical protein
MKTKLQTLLAAHRALSYAAEAVAKEFAENPDFRNRSKRQQLTVDLFGQMPSAIAFGRVVDRIAKECQIEL